jgi:hypothetical protein
LDDTQNFRRCKICWTQMFVWIGELDSKNFESNSQDRF